MKQPAATIELRLIRADDASIWKRPRESGIEKNSRMLKEWLVLEQKVHSFGRGKDGEIERRVYE